MAAREMGGLSLYDALTLCELLAQADPARYERAALRWLQQFIDEQEAIDAYLSEQDARRALEDCLRDDPERRGLLRVEEIAVASPTNSLNQTERLGFSDHQL